MDSMQGLGDTSFDFNSSTSWPPSSSHQHQQSLGIPLLTSPPFGSNSLALPSFVNTDFGSAATSAYQPPSWQLDHAPSWQPPDLSSPRLGPVSSATANSASGTAHGPPQPQAQPSTATVRSSSSFLSPLPLTSAALAPEPPSANGDHGSAMVSESGSDQPQAGDFGFLELLGSPLAGDGALLMRDEDDFGHGQLRVEEDEDRKPVVDSGNASGSEDGSSEDGEQEDEEQEDTALSSQAHIESKPAPLAWAPPLSMSAAFIAQQHSFEPVSYTYSPQQLQHNPVTAGNIDASTRSLLGLYEDDDEGEEDEDEDGEEEEESDEDHGVKDEETPPTSNSSDHGTTHNSPFSLEAYHGSTTASGFVHPLSAKVEEDVFIPALSHPRSAHLRAAYTSEEKEMDRLLGAADPDFDYSTVGEVGASGGRGGSGAGKKRKRSQSGPASAAASTSAVEYPYAWSVTVPPPPRAHDHGTRRSISSDRQDGTPSTFASNANASALAFAPAPKKKKKKSSSSNLPGPYSLMNSNGTLRKRTEIPAVEDDPSIRPYGCNFPACPARLRRPAPRMENGRVVEQVAPQDQTSWRTVRELREHCAEHKRVGMDGGQLPFRCALDPCGKTFKSLAGLRFHFQNASANGHFFVSHEEGEDQPSKKFKPCVQPTERSEKCPVQGCSKAFKQAAGLAYHLAHTPGHDMSEAMVSTFAATLQSKTRWWYAKLGRQLL